MAHGTTRLFHQFIYTHMVSAFSYTLGRAIEDEGRLMIIVRTLLL